MTTKTKHHIQIGDIVKSNTKSIRVHSFIEHIDIYVNFREHFKLPINSNFIFLGFEIMDKTESTRPVSIYAKLLHNECVVYWPSFTLWGTNSLSHKEIIGTYFGQCQTNFKNFFERVE